MDDLVLDCASGRELIERGLRDDVVHCARVDVSTTVPILRGGAFEAR